ncbi:hypothetical protein JX266_011644 [Neoarthrinium moseri]|nr:hypothetical protein JX266_011644 [Neoarthrinium moseri]
MEAQRNAGYALIRDLDSSAATESKPDLLSCHWHEALARRIAWTVAIGLLVIIAVGAALFGTFRAELFTVGQDQTSQHQAAGVSPWSCGSSREEALVAGCQFDVVSFSWLPPDCYDGELVAQFEARGPWQWYVGRDGGVTADAKAVREGRLDRLYVTWEFHLLHCTFQWKKMHRAMLAGRPIDSYIGNFSHTQHCERMIMNRRTQLNSTGTDIFIKYPSCGLA